MRRRTFLRFVAAAAALLPAARAFATPVRYALDAAHSTVGFETDFGPDKITGNMPVASADLAIDFERVTNSRVSVVLDATRARASFPFAAQALKGPKVLDVQVYPLITFDSISVRRQGDNARIEGALTIRGVTRPATLIATIFRQTGSQPGDLSRLTIRLVGAVRRSAFGATGWPDMVGDEVRIEIIARIMRAA
ncbi:Protein YceI [Defluviimonas aquaemixtae]|uniref:Protein YceI n=1 Tax=Albidovulum aquaemixtae TaxID=1542388 RepID=A0A2R8B3H1_9RHOB|nr:YceI family protein [Defluviimonas aquaemixtae]SPH17169.1 Protein YceI [Defluviimonas aquaemixtae]